MSKATGLLSAKQIDAIAMSRYGVPVAKMDPLTGDWLARFLVSDYGQSGFAVWKRIDAMMRKAGGSLSFPQWGSPLFPV